VAVGGRDRTSMIYFGQSRGMHSAFNWTSLEGPDCNHRDWGGPISGPLPAEERAALLRELREHYGSRWPRMRDGIERAWGNGGQARFCDLGRRMARRHPCRRRSLKA